MRYLFSSALMLFWAYAAKETSIYLMPAFLAGIFLLKKNLRHMIIFSAFLFALFLIECGLFWLFTGDFLARVHSVSGNHLELEKLVPVTFFDLFRRYTDSPFF
jgi:hypothetical protein